MSTQYIPSIGMFCKNWGGCGSCEEEESFWKLYIQLVFGTALLSFFNGGCLTVKN